MSYPTYEDQVNYQIKIGGKTAEFTIGKFSEQTSAAVLARCGDTIIHVTIALGDKVDWGYFPLHVEYEEKLYASGIIKGSRWVKREGRPTDDAILKARAIDRSIRPLFPKGITNQVQVVTTVFSYDGVNSHDTLALAATGLALSISEIPFNGPLAGLRIGYQKENQEYVINPSEEKQEELDLDLVVSGSDESVVMVEAAADEVDEEIVISAIGQAQTELKKICLEIKKIAAEIGKEKVTLVPSLTEEAKARQEKITQAISDKYEEEIHEAVVTQAHLEELDLDALAEKIADHINETVMTEDEPAVEPKAVKEIIYELMNQEARRMILEDKERPDGRKPDEIRPIWTKIDIFPRTHGSAMFKRGATQAATVTTLGSPSLGQHIEDIEGEEVRHYIHHYNMPPYAAGETGRFGYPKRREIGHGALAEKALLPMIPSQKEFPYTIRVVSEILSSNGSTSQASICGSSMSLMAAGVPIKKPVAGIAMGLMSEQEDLDNYVILSDIQGLEDHVGDMDFKVAGTKDGITAIQMDIKLTGITVDLLRQALTRAKQGRLHILGKMLDTIEEPREELCQFAPKVHQLEIPADRIGEVIGPGGKIIKEIINLTEAEVDIEEDEEREVGIVNIASDDIMAINKAKKMIENILKTVEIDEVYEGTVTRIENYGAFVEFLPGREGLVHISQMAIGYVKDPRSLVKVGDEIKVRIAEIKDDGKIGLSMLSKEEERKMNQRKRSRRK